MSGTLPYRQEIAEALAAPMARSAGVDAAFRTHMKRLEAFLPALRQWQEQATPPQLALPQRTDDLAEIGRQAERLRARFSHVAVLGTGGSSLGARMLAALKEGESGPVALHFLENTDPHGFAAAFAALPPGRTAFLAISKSGSTVETLAQAACAIGWMQSRKADVADSLLAITMPGDNPLRAMAEGQGCAVLDHDPALGGRYSVLSVVGLLPAALLGLDIGALRRGAADVMRSDLRLPMEGAALQHALAGAGANISVLMPYCDRLRHLSDWQRQLWAESLGKDGKGATLVRALGAVDQHSQLQLYLDGPRDKLITLLLLENAGQGPALPEHLLKDERLAYLRGRTVGDVIDAQQRATRETLVRRGVPVRALRLERLAERELGALLMHFMLETIFAAHLMGVDAFDQPAVEESKTLARKYLGGK